jgi:hypothetical protein
MLQSFGLTHFQIALLNAITFDLANIPGETPQALKSATVEFQGLWKETVDLSDNLYTPKFGLPG